MNVKMSRLSSMSRVNKSTNAELLIKIDLISTTALAVNYLETSIESTSLNANLEFISMGAAKVNYSDKGECDNYFEVLIKLAKSDFPCVMAVYGALKAATYDSEGIQHIKNNSKLLEYLLSCIPKIENYEEFLNVHKKKSAQTVEILAILQQVTQDLPYTFVNISFKKVIENLASIFTALATNQLNEQKIACYALISILNLCRANYARICWAEVPILLEPQFISKLLLFKTPENFDTLPTDPNKDEMPAYSPLLVAHLLILLEKATSPLPPRQLSKHIEWSYNSLISAIQNKHTSVVIQATHYLSDLMNMKHLRNFVVRSPEHKNRFEEVIDCILEYGHVDPLCDGGVMKLLCTMVCNLQTPLEDQLVRKTLSMCITYLVQFSNSLLEKEVDTYQEKLIEGVTSLASGVLENFHDGSQFVGELDEILPYCVTILITSIDLETKESLPADDEDWGYLESTLKLMICMWKFVDLSATIQATLTEEHIDTLNKGFILEKKGKISNVIVSYLVLLSCNKEWNGSFEFLIQNDEICEHVVYALKFGNPYATLQASKVLNLIQKQSYRVVMEKLEEQTLHLSPQNLQKSICIMSKCDAARVDEALSNQYQNNDKRSFQDPTNYAALIDMLQTYQFRMNDLLAQRELLQENLNAANNLATYHIQQHNTAQDQLLAVTNKMLHAEMNRHDSLVQVHSLNKKLKLSEDINVKVKKDMDAMFERARNGEVEIARLTTITDEQKKALHQTEEKTNKALKKIAQLEASEAAREEKLVKYKKDCTALNHKNGVLAKELEVLKMEKQDLQQKLDQNEKELQELQRIHDMVAKLTSKK